jgi:hypothetical protein
LAQQQRRGGRDSFSIMHHFWQIAPARSGRAAVRWNLPGWRAILHATRNRGAVTQVYSEGSGKQAEHWHWRAFSRAGIWFPVTMVQSLVASTPISSLSLLVTGPDTSSKSGESHEQTQQSSRQF